MLKTHRFYILCGGKQGVLPRKTAKNCSFLPEINNVDKNVENSVESVENPGHTLQIAIKFTNL